ncbi:MAG TPA: hypothetical protein VNO30_12350 [Kofleriaceae bacterium]|nr:hypothetical protein [Kofleriaceae bacterium]
MSAIRKLLETDGTGWWKIDLATHIGSPIDNETSLPKLEIVGARLRNERRFQEMYTLLKAPIAGYNCFGHVLACRRTSIKKPNLDLIFAEDGIAEIDPKHVAVGDIVVYSDSEGPTHIARVSRFIDDNGIRLPVVISKFDDVSGEYEHRMSDVRWDQKPLEIDWRIYRERARDPRKWQDWRTLIAGEAESGR